MTLTEQVKILNGKIKSNKAQYDLDRQAAKISALSSGELEKYEYLTGKDLEYKPKVLETVKVQYSPLGEALKHNVKTKTDKIIKKDKGDKFLVYNQKHSFAKFKDISDFKEISLDSMHSDSNDFHKKFITRKGVNPQTEANKDLKAKVLDNAGDIFTYTKKNMKKKKKEALNEKDTKKLTTKKLRLSDDYEYESEEEGKTEKKPDKERTT